jgi:hypothetical protein
MHCPGHPRMGAAVSKPRAAALRMLSFLKTGVPHIWRFFLAKLDFAALPWRPSLKAWIAQPSSPKLVAANPCTFKRHAAAQLCDGPAVLTFPRPPAQYCHPKLPQTP